MKNTRVLLPCVSVLVRRRDMRNDGKLKPWVARNYDRSKINCRGNTVSRMVALIKHAYVQTKMCTFSYTVNALYFYPFNGWFTINLCPCIGNCNCNFNYVIVPRSLGLI